MDKSIYLLIAAILSVTFSFSDTLHLINDDILNGTIISADDSTVCIRNSKQSIIVRKSNITACEFSRMDIIRLHDGSEISGKVFRRGTESIEYLTNEGMHIISTDDVQEVDVNCGGSLKVDELPTLGSEFVNYPENFLYSYQFKKSMLLGLAVGGHYPRSRNRSQFGTADPALPKVSMDGVRISAVLGYSCSHWFDVGAGMEWFRSGQADMDGTTAANRFQYRFPHIQFRYKYALHNISNLHQYLRTDAGWLSGKEYITLDNGLKHTADDAQPALRFSIGASLQPKAVEYSLEFSYLFCQPLQFNYDLIGVDNRSFDFSGPGITFRFAVLPAYNIENPNQD